MRACVRACVRVRSMDSETAAAITMKTPVRGNFSPRSATRIGFDLSGQGQGQGSNVRRGIFINNSDQHQNDITGANGHCENHGRLGFDLRGRGQGSTLVSSISCSDNVQNDILGVNVRCAKCGSLRFYLRGQGQGQGLCQRHAQQ